MVTKLLPSFNIENTLDRKMPFMLWKSRIVNDLNIPTEVVVDTTVREKDGLAMSSRNVILQRRTSSVQLCTNLSGTKYLESQNR